MGPPQVEERVHYISGSASSAAERKGVSFFLREQALYLTLCSEACFGLSACLPTPQWIHSHHKLLCTPSFRMMPVKTKP